MPPGFFLPVRVLSRPFRRLFLEKLAAAHDAGRRRKFRSATVRQEVEILAPDQVKTLLDGLRGHRLYPIAVLGLATGMRRGELVALRWGDVDLDRGRIRVARSIEQTNEGPRFKLPKTKAGRREIAIPLSITAELRSHWRRHGPRTRSLRTGRTRSAV